MAQGAKRSGGPRVGFVATMVTMAIVVWATPGSAQNASPRDPVEPLGGAPQIKIPARPTGGIERASIDEKSMQDLIHQLAACGTRLTISSWTDPRRGIGCARDRVTSRLNEIAKASGGKLQVIVDKFEARAERTGGKPVSLENVYAVLPGSEPRFARILFIVSGHMDSRPTDVMDPRADAPGADDDGSGTAVSIECARLLSMLVASGQGSLRATVLFAAVSGEEQGELGSARMLEWTKQQGYTVKGMLDDDIVGADPAPGRPHRVRLFSASGDMEDYDSPSRELARTIEEIDGRDAIRLVFRVDRYGRGGDHFPFFMAGLPAVRFTEPWEDYNHQHQTPRTENGVEYGDLEKYLDFVLERSRSCGGRFA